MLYVRTGQCIGNLQHFFKSLSPSLTIYHASLNIFAIISMLACANVSFPPLFLNSHVYSVCGTLIPSLPPPSLPPLHLLPLCPATAHHSSSSSSRCYAEYTARIRGINDRQNVPELGHRRRSFSFSGWSL